VLAQLAPLLASAAEGQVVSGSDVGDPGVRLEAAGVRAFLPLVDGVPGDRFLLVFLNPDPGRVPGLLPQEGPTGGDLAGVVRRVLTASRWASELSIVRAWLSELGGLVASHGEEAAALEALAIASGSRVVVCLTPLPQGVGIFGAWRDGGSWRRASETVNRRWEAVSQDPRSAAAAGDLAEPVSRSARWSWGRSRAVEPPAILGLADGGRAVSQEGAELFASLLARALVDRRVAAATRHTTLLQERARIASLIHEGLTQVLSNVAIQLEVLDQFLDDPQQASAMVRGSRAAVLEALDSLRGAVFELAPASPEWTDLSTGLERYVADYGAQWGLALDFRVDGTPAEVSEEVLALAFAVVQEGLTNLRKHARTTSGEITLAFEPGWATVTVCDGGVGFDPETTERQGFRQHQGLQLTRTRVRLMGGRFEVVSAPGRGTCIRMRVPI
jgi:signal transduction histidine kinase